MQLSNNGIQWLLPILLSGLQMLSYTTASTDLMGAKSIFEIGMTKPTNVAEIDSLTDLLANRDLDSEMRLIFNRAKQVINQITPEQTCQAAAAFDLFRICRSSKSSSTDDVESTARMEVGKSVYGIRLGLCETQVANVEVPKACRRLQSMPVQARGWFRTQGRESGDFSDKEITKCLEILQSKHFYWTSYSNNRQNADALCTASSHDMAQTQMLNIYSQLADLLPDFRDALSDMRKELLETAIHQRGYAQELKRFNDEARENIEDNHAAAVKAIYDIRTKTESQIGDLSSMLLQSHNTVDNHAIGIDKALHSFSNNLEKLTQQMTEKMQAASSGYGDLVILQEKTYRDVHDMAIETVQRAVSHEQGLQKASQGLVQHIQQLSDSFPQVAQEIAALQQEQLARTRQQLDLQGQTIEISHLINQYSERHSQGMAKAVSESSLINDLLAQMTEKSKQIDNSLSSLSTLLTGLSWINPWTCLTLILLYVFTQALGLLQGLLLVTGVNLMFHFTTSLWTQYTLIDTSIIRDPSTSTKDHIPFVFMNNYFVVVVIISFIGTLSILLLYLKRRNLHTAASPIKSIYDDDDKDDGDYAPPESDEESDIFDGYSSEEDEETVWFRREYTAPL